MDSEGNRYNVSGTFATTYNAADESLSGLYSKGSGDTLTVSFGSVGSVTVTYDSWGRVVQTASSPSGTGGPNGGASYTTYAYDALGRQIATTNYSTANTVISGTNTYFDGANPIEVRMQDNSTLLETNVWSPADGRLILRDAVAAQLHSYTGLTITPNSANGIQRLYPMTDGAGSIVAVASPSGTVQERYTYTVDGLPQALNADWTPRTAGGTVQYASTLGWNWLYRGQQWVQTQPDTSTTQCCGLYVTASGQWYDPVHATALQPNLADYGDPQVNPYQMSAGDRLLLTYGPMILGIGITIATGGLGAPVALAAALGGAVAAGVNSYAAGGDAGQVMESAAIGGIAGMMGGSAGEFAGVLAQGALSSIGVSCAEGVTGLAARAAGLAIGASEGAAYSAADAFVQTGLMTGNAVDVVMAGWNAGVNGAELGGALGAIFHQVCFVAGTQVLARPVDQAATPPDRCFGPRTARGSGGRTVPSPGFSLPTFAMKPDHPLYVVGKGWTPVCEVQPGETLLRVDETAAAARRCCVAVDCGTSTGTSRTFSPAITS